MMCLHTAQGKEERRTEQRVVEVVGIPTYVEKAKANGTFSAMIRAHVFGDTVSIEIDGEVRMSLCSGVVPSNGFNCWPALSL